MPDRGSGAPVSLTPTPAGFFPKRCMTVRAISALGCSVVVDGCIVLVVIIGFIARLDVKPVWLSGRRWHIGSIDTKGTRTHVQGNYCDKYLELWNS